jgi:4'-phosphopantetheinyl transferase
MSVVRDGPAVWVLDLQRVPGPDPSLRWHAAGLVSDEELERARRFCDALARSRHLAGRAVIRHAVGVRAHCRPDEIGIVTKGAGKPLLSLPWTGAAWHFNLSHSGNFIACVVDRVSVGIDVETTARDVDHAAIARAHFSPAEARWIGEADARGKHRFTALWTLKEAFLKAVGLGISVPLSGFVFSALKPRSCCVRSGDLPEAGTWHCRFLPLQRDYWLSVCSRRPMGQLQINWTVL